MAERFLSDPAIPDIDLPIEKDDQYGTVRESDSPNLKRVTAADIRQFSDGFYLSIGTDAAVTLTVLTDEVNVRHTGTLTADRTATLQNTDAYAGAKFWITRTGGGAFDLNVRNHDATLLKALATDTWGKFVYDGSNWYLAAYGDL